MASVNPLIYKGVYQPWSLNEPNISCAAPSTLLAPIAIHGVMRDTQLTHSNRFCNFATRLRV
jgi:hypothetical protein